MCADLRQTRGRAVLTPLLLALPWVAFAALAVARLRGLPDALPEDVTLPADPPPVSVVVPARNEAANIVCCLESLAASRYPTFEIIVVDDRSEDGTRELTRSVTPGGARRIAVLDGEPLPEGWLGKPWACWQGARVATGEVLLFTDADTLHGPDLLVAPWPIWSAPAPMPTPWPDGRSSARSGNGWSSPRSSRSSSSASGAA